MSMNTGDMSWGIEYEAVIVGAGFAGLYALHRLRDTLGLTVKVFDIAGDVGGTWYWNRYPGARCDIESWHYSYSFSEELQQEWTWSERFAGQSEILRYLQHVADRFDLRRDIQFDTAVTAATYDEATDRWDIETNDGERTRARYLISAVGNLSAIKEPDFAGVEQFSGPIYSTARWPHEQIDFTGLRVGVIGTGSSGIQIIPEMAEQAAHLTVFQRTANYATPLRNIPLARARSDRIKASYRELRAPSRDSFGGLPYARAHGAALATTAEQRQRIYEECWNEGGFAFFIGSFSDILSDREANETAAEFIRAKIRERVTDPNTAELLVPRGYAYGTKRPPLETNYYETFNLDHVDLIDVGKEPIAEITARGIQIGNTEYSLDTMIFALGFDAMTGPLLRMGITGRAGLTLNEAWSAGPQTYLGLMTHDFPNLFMITGPQSPAAFSVTPIAIENHVDWISDCIAYLRDHDAVSIEPTRHAQDRWVAHTNKLAERTLLPSTNSWYTGANIPGKPRVCMVYTGSGSGYQTACREAADEGYTGFHLRLPSSAPESRQQPTPAADTA
ncbi:NAD(P)/FAD-dependent oxidoreductase [Nocardia sp. NPDC046473]|uniref:flavin-containing monooxygenase n=1 Tax=Nocardia sp. NPDC046473 TaxID=3155733 RepID=UPI0033F06F5E